MGRTPDEQREYMRAYRARRKATPIDAPDITSVHSINALRANNDEIPTEGQETVAIATIERLADIEEITPIEPTYDDVYEQLVAALDRVNELTGEVKQLKARLAAKTEWTSDSLAEPGFGSSRPAPKPVSAKKSRKPASAADLDAELFG